MSFRAAVVLLLMSSVSSKCLPFNIPSSSGTEKKSLGGWIRWIGRVFQLSYLFSSYKLRCSNSSPTFSRRHTKTHANINICHSERDCHRSTTTQLWNADMSTSSNHAKAFVLCCHGKHTVASWRTWLSHHVCKNSYHCVGTSIIKFMWT